MSIIKTSAVGNELLIVKLLRRDGKTMIIFGEYSVEHVFAMMDASAASKTVLEDGRTFKKNSQRLLLFRSNHICVKCGVEGSVFVLESHKQDITPHMNLYALNDQGNRVLMTKDHIHPRSKGGPDKMSNYQTMCLRCNNKKGNKIV